MVGSQAHRLHPTCISPPFLLRASFGATGVCSGYNQRLTTVRSAFHQEGQETVNKNASFFISGGTMLRHVLHVTLEVPSSTKTVSCRCSQLNNTPVNTPTFLNTPLTPSLVLPGITLQISYLHQVSSSIWLGGTQTDI